MYLSFPRHEILAAQGVGIPYSAHLLYDLCAYRDSSENLSSRVSAELGFGLIAASSLVETVVRIPIVLVALCFSENRSDWFRGYKLSVLTIFYALYAVCINLFVQNVSRPLIEFDASLETKGEVQSLFSACQAGDQALAKKLIENGCDPHAKYHETISPAIAARLYGHKGFDEICPLEKWEESYLNLKRLSHWLSLEGNISFEGEDILLQGVISSRLFFGAFASALGNFTETNIFNSCCFLKKTHADILKEALEKAESEHSYETIADSIQNHSLTFVDAGWKNHSVCLCFNSEYLAIGNRGDHSDKHSTLSLFKIKPGLMTPAIIEEIATHQLLDDARGVDYFYRILPGKLSLTGAPKKDNYCTEMEKIAPKTAQAGNCSLSGKKSALRFAWASLLAQPPHNEHLTMEQAFERGRQETKLFTNWAANQCFSEVEPTRTFPNISMPTMRLAIARSVAKLRRFNFLRGKLDLHPFRSLLGV